MNYNVAVTIEDTKTGFSAKISIEGVKRELVAKPGGGDKFFAAVLAQIDQYSPEYEYEKIEGSNGS